MRVVFLGTPDFAVPSLRSIAASRHEVVCVVSQPDRPRDRGRVSASPVKAEAEKLGLPVLQFEKIVRDGGADELAKYGADVMVTCAYGQILDQRLLSLTRHGVINVHASLLPAYRGSSPIQWAVINGEKTTGVTTMRTSLGLDRGDIIEQASLDIGESETAGELFVRLADLGAELIVSTLDKLEAGTAVFTPQDESRASYFPMFRKESGLIDVNGTVTSFVNFVRGTSPWPGAYGKVDGKVFKIHRARAMREDEPCPRRRYFPGEFAAFFGKLHLALIDGLAVLEEVQLEGGKKMSGEAFLLGHSDINGKTIEV